MLEDYTARVEELAHQLDFDSEDITPEEVTAGMNELQSMWEAIAQTYGEETDNADAVAAMRLIEGELRRWRHINVAVVENNNGPLTDSPEAPQGDFEGRVREALEETRRAIKNMSVEDLEGELREGENGLAEAEAERRGDADFAAFADEVRELLDAIRREIASRKENISATKSESAVSPEATQEQESGAESSEVHGEDTKEVPESVTEEAELTAEQIEALDEPAEVKDAALAWLDGDQSLANQLAYVALKQKYATNISRDRAGSGAEEPGVLRRDGGEAPGLEPGGSGRLTDDESSAPGGVRYRLGDPAGTFRERQRAAVANRGTVAPGLKEAEVAVVDITEEDKVTFDLNQGKAALKKDASDYARLRGIIGTMTNEETNGKGKIKISKSSIDKFVDDSASDKSIGKGVHFAVLSKIRELIANSLLAEEHPDVNKKDGGREWGNGINDDLLIHRAYAAARINGEYYRVKLTFKEYADSNKDNKAYSYEVAKIELMPGLTTTPVGAPSLNDINSISGAKLLNNLTKSYDKNVKLLEASEKSGEVQSGEAAMRGHGAAGV